MFERKCIGWLVDLFGQSVIWSACHSVSCSVDQSVHLSVMAIVDRLVSRVCARIWSVGQFVSWIFGKLVNWSVCGQNKPCHTHSNALLKCWPTSRLEIKFAFFIKFILIRRSDRL